MSGGMFMNSSSSSSNESHSDDDKCHLPTAALIDSDHNNEEQDEGDEEEERRVVIRRNLSRLKRQCATTSLQSPRPARNVSSIDAMNNEILLSEQIMIDTASQIAHHSTDDSNRTSFNESERTDSGIGRDSGSTWRLSTYSDSFHHLEQRQQADKQQGIYMSLNTFVTLLREGIR
jgi:hypothetical protein